MTTQTRKSHAGQTGMRDPQWEKDGRIEVNRDRVDG
jgi:hypothetical protein